MDRVETMRIAVGAADRVVGALEAGAWPDDRSPGGTFLSALVDYAAGPQGPEHPFARQGVVRALGQCRDHVEAGTSRELTDSLPTPIRERAAWGHSIFYERIEASDDPEDSAATSGADTAAALQELVADHPHTDAVPASSPSVLAECLGWALYWKGGTEREEGRLREAEQWYRSAFDAGQLAARNDLACVLDQLGQARAARALWTTAARDGDASAARNLGAYYERVGDAVQSETWFRRATELGHLDAGVRLGQRLHDRGETAEAEQLWRRAAAEGIGDACEFLGVLLLEREDAEGARLWLEKAAIAGHPGACRQLATLYERLGDTEKAVDWLRAAAAHGHPTAGDDLDKLTRYNPTGEELADLSDPKPRRRRRKGKSS